MEKNTVFIRNRQELEHIIITKHGEGWSIRELSRSFNLGRNTVRRIIRSGKARRDEGCPTLPDKKTPRSSKLDPHLPLIRQILDSYPDITGERLYDKLKEAGYKGGITIVRQRLREIRPRPKRTPTVRFETEPGLQGQMDWSLYTIPFRRTGKTQVLCFSYILGFSRRHYIDFTINRKFHTLIRRHQDAFRHFDGVPKQCLYDGEKTILLRWEAGQPVYNPSFIDFITHYCCKPLACRPGRPQTKGKIEAPFQYVEKNFLNGRTFQDLDALKEKAQWWLQEKSDLHIHDTTGRPPLELFLHEEQAALIPLPHHHYDSSEVALRICRIDGFLEFETNLYSVPYEYVADILTLKATEHEIFIYRPDLAVVAHHERLAPGMSKKVEKVEHRTCKKIRYGLEPVKEAFLRLGDGAPIFLPGLKKKFPRSSGFHARSILRLKENYHSDDINRALHHANRYHAFSAKAIEHILQARAQPRTLESIRNDRARKSLKHSLPTIKQRSLKEYGDLLSPREDEHE